MLRCGAWLGGPFANGPYAWSLEGGGWWRADFWRTLLAGRPFDRLRANGLGKGTLADLGRTGSCRRFGVARGWAGRSRTAPTRGLWRAGVGGGRTSGGRCSPEGPSTGSGRTNWVRALWRTWGECWFVAGSIAGGCWRAWGAPPLWIPAGPRVHAGAGVRGWRGCGVWVGVWEQPCFAGNGFRFFTPLRFVQNDSSVRIPVIEASGSIGEMPPPLWIPAGPGFTLPCECRDDGVVAWVGTAGRVVRERPLRLRDGGLLADAARRKALRQAQGERIGGYALAD